MPAWPRVVPDSGTVLEFLRHLDELHRAAGRPIYTEIGRRVHLVPSRLSAFFTGNRLINSDNLELLVECLGGDLARAEGLRLRTTLEWPEWKVQAGGQEGSRRVLRELMRSSSAPAGSARRARVLLLAAEGRRTRRPLRSSACPARPW